MVYLFCYLFNDDHVLQLIPETVAVHRRMNSLDDYNGQSNGIQGQILPKFSDIRLQCSNKRDLTGIELLSTAAVKEKHYAYNSYTCNPLLMNIELYKLPEKSFRS